MESKKFKNTEFISPIYGKMNEHIEYPKIKAIDKNDDLSLSFSQQTIEGAIIHRANYFGIDFSPEYQRDYVWDLEDKVDLIDSIFNNIEIGKFVFIHNIFNYTNYSFHF